MSKCAVAYCANERPCPAHERAPAPWAKSRRRRRQGPTRNDRAQCIADHGAKCYICGAAKPEAELEVDHVIPRSEGGPDTPGNRRPACRRCHRRKTQAEAARARARTPGGGPR